MVLEILDQNTDDFNHIARGTSENFIYKILKARTRTYLYCSISGQKYNLGSSKTGHYPI